MKEDKLKRLHIQHAYEIINQQGGCVRIACVECPLYLEQCNASFNEYESRLKLIDRFFADIEIEEMLTDEI
jgi:hypothetical protein